MKGCFVIVIINDLALRLFTLARSLDFPFSLRREGGAIFPPLNDSGIQKEQQKSKKIKARGGAKIWGLDGF